ncbi:MmcQ/YjbR family DNA-binding protein [Enterococcus sp. AZ126]|uniref:MmcQ/YjbR family DNA-binding protein n=1 Tax=Enterococcus sp. AZ126 TaxID=2774635 RepID=UPI003F68878F
MLNKIFRYKRNKKWFGIIMTISKNKLYGNEDTKIDSIDLKINSELGEIFRNKKGYHRAYHMNKEHWITIDLSAIDNFGQVAELIDDSFKLS